MDHLKALAEYIKDLESRGSKTRVVKRCWAEKLITTNFGGLPAEDLLKKVSIKFTMRIGLF